ncbi:MAG: GNAT family N-acetyltransferase [Opitutus sp.]
MPARETSGTPVSEPLFTLRPATAADYRWLWELKRQTMRPYVEETWGGWDDAAQEAFFRRNFSSETVQIIQVDDRNAGLLNLEHEARELFLANLQIAPDWQYRGLGTAVIRTLLETARALQKPIRLQVLRVNTSALRLYARMGFATYQESPTHYLMRWRPATR